MCRKQNPGRRYQRSCSFIIVGGSDCPSKRGSAKHTQAPTNADFPKEPNVSQLTRTDLTVEEIYKVVLSFPNGSAGGIDGLRPQHLKDLLGGLKDESASRLCENLSKLVEHILMGNVPNTICPFLYGASLTALRKKDGGIRPIAVGNTLRRLAGKVVSKRLMAPMGTLLRPVQMGYGTTGGAEAAVHSTRSFIDGTHKDCRVLLKLDFRNAFNTIRRDMLLRQVQSTIPQFYPFVWQLYRNPSHLFFGEHMISSESGVQQGDPLGPLLFCLVIKGRTEKYHSDLNLWYLDDGTLGGDVETVSQDLQMVLEEAPKLGLSLNLTKCEVYVAGGSDLLRESALHNLSSVFANLI